MFVKTSLGLPCASKSKPQHSGHRTASLKDPMFVKASKEEEPSFVVALEPSPFFDTISWQHEPAIMYAEDRCTYWQSGVTRLAATSPEHFAPWGAHRQIHRYSEGSYATDKQETGSDASTADSSPYFVDEGFYMDGRSAPPVTADLPVPVFGHDLSHQQQLLQQSWQQTGWTDFQNFPDVPQTEIFTAGSARHGHGQCKPCAFSWKPEGCQSGTGCKFCHICLPGEKQRRKKVLRNLQRNVGPCKFFSTYTATQQETMQGGAY